MLHPYQCLLSYSRPGQAEAGVLVAACGPFLHTFSVQDGKYLSTWPSNKGIDPSKNNRPEPREGFKNVRSEDPDQDSPERPEKRRKLSPARDDSGSSAEIVVDGGEEAVSSIQTNNVLNPSFIKLAGTSNGQYVVAVTGEDKCIRVFTLSGIGILTQLSERLMPKRPCAVDLTPDDSTILCADKFGDVYSLPLMGQTYKPAVASPEGIPTSTDKANKISQNKFVPAATSLTVHTKGNRGALHQQQKITYSKVEKKSLNFDHQLLLGHVSLLTDVICVAMTPSAGKSRDYVFTSDRDEHIRISRGIPQAHIVQGYCLGHTEFVSKLCIPPACPHLLISGGGDDYLLLWDWLAGTIQQRIDLKTFVEAFKKSYMSFATTAKPGRNGQSMAVDIKESHTGERLAVSNITVGEGVVNDVHECHTEIIVTCEGVPALFLYRLRPNGTMTFEGSISLEGNVLDVVFLKERHSIIYSMDTIHKPMSTTVVACDQDQTVRPVIGVLRFNSDISSYEKILKPTGSFVAAMYDVINDQTSGSQEAKVEGKSIRDLLYGLESLRKRGTEEYNDIDER